MIKMDWRLVPRWMVARVVVRIRNSGEFAVGDTINMNFVDARGCDVYFKGVVWATWIGFAWAYDPDDLGWPFDRLGSGRSRQRMQPGRASWHEVHMALSTGRVACSGKSSASYTTDEISVEWPDVTCPKCRKVHLLPD